MFFVNSNTFCVFYSPPAFPFATLENQFAIPKNQCVNLGIQLAIPENQLATLGIQLAIPENQLATLGIQKQFSSCASCASDA
jgi:hypothetical protein